MSEQLVEEAKKKASYAAIDAHVTAETKIIGIGSGSTVVYCVERLAQIVEEGKVAVKACVPTSFQAKQLIMEAGLPLADLNSYPEIDVAFDGADEADSQLNCIKGGGGCQLQEKLVAAAAKKFVIVADYRKDSAVLGTQWTKGVPVEVIPMAYVSIEKKIASLGGTSTLRMATRKAGPVVTDNGNLILDVDFGRITEPQRIHLLLIQIPGVVETGLFCSMATWAYFGCADGSVKVVTTPDAKILTKTHIIDSSDIRNSQQQGDSMQEHLDNIFKTMRPDRFDHFPSLLFTSICVACLTVSQTPCEHFHSSHRYLNDLNASTSGVSSPMKAATASEAKIANASIRSQATPLNRPDIQPRLSDSTERLLYKRRSLELAFDTSLSRMAGEMDIDEEIRLAQEARQKAKASRAAASSKQPQADKVALVGSVSYDKELYSTKDDLDRYDMDLSLNDDVEHEPESGGGSRKMLSSFTAPKDVYKDLAAMDEDQPDPMANARPSRRIIDREDDYRKQRLQRQLSPDRVDAFAGDKPANARSYNEVMKEAELDREYDKTMKKVKEKQEELRKEAKEAREALASRPAIVAKPEAVKEKAAAPKLDGAEDPATQGAKPRKRRWDQTAENMEEAAKPKKSEWDEDEDEGGKKKAEVAPTPTKKRNRWDETPVAPGPMGGSVPSWDATPKGGVSQTPKKSRWDETPVGFNPFGATPVGTAGMNIATPVPGQGGVPATPEAMNAIRWEKEIDARNRPFSDEELDSILPSEGYKILEPPASYVPIRTPARKLTATPTPVAGMVGAGFMMQGEGDSGLAPGSIPMGVDVPPEIAGVGALQFFKPEDLQHFGKLMSDTRDESELSVDELKERKIMRLLLKIKNGTPPIRKSALRQITDKAREFGPASLFNQILPLLMSPTLEDQERHLLVKVIDRVLYKLDDLVRPYVHKILVVIEPLLIDEDYYARVEGREIISNLSKAAGLATMIATMRPDIDHVDEYVRNTTARAFSVVASALGIPALMPFLKAVCRSKKSWQARHTGIKIVQQIAILMGCAVLPHLKNLVEAIAHGLEDEEQQKVRTITALAIAALAEAAHPYGIESFDSVLRPLWAGTKKHRGKGLAAILKAIGYIIPLMDAEYANFYTKEVMAILIREFQSPDEEMKKIVLKVIKQCCGTDGVEPAYIRAEILPEFFKNFWVRRMALDRRNSKQLVETTVELSQKVGVAEIAGRIVEDLKDESEPYRKMVMETIEKVVVNLGAADIDERLEETLIDGILYAFQEQTIEDVIMLNGFGTVVNALGMRAKPYIPQICSTILWRLNNKSAKVRQQAADLISRIAVVLRTCGEEKVMAHLGLVLYEYLGEEYPEVLGSILRALKSIVNVIGMSSMTPPIKDLLPRCTPILKNRHEKVQENCIDLVGRIADRGAEFVSAREWMRICFELLDMLKAHKKGIRRATVNTFGYIAKAIGPQDVLATLLNNLKVQERQNRVCTTVAIAIVAETCSPFTVLPALMNEYRVPELNVQNGVLKSLSFLFEYIGEMGKDYIYAVTPLLEDALMDRDLVHRQTACTTVKHMALGVVGLGCEDALLHLMNYVFPNVFETSPHVINAVMEAVEGMRMAVGPCTILQYILQGMYHPARRVREVYWKIFNNLYIGSQDALVAFYPRLDDDSRNKYQRYELDIIV
ncbi:Splicing factor 3B subunit 1 [Dinochytrium kinnereticum]|nr:Splicing factor 3B subunit 1 [Dinochytrium kinnereticum]